MARPHPPHPQYVSQLYLKWTPVNVIFRFMIFVPLDHLHVQVHFGAVNVLAVPLLIGASFIDRYVNANLLPKGRVVRVRSLPVRITSEYTPLSDQLSVLQSHSDAGISTNDRQDNSERKLIFRVGKCVAITPVSETSVSVMNCSTGLIYFTPQLDSMQNRMVYSVSGIVNPCHTCQPQ